MSTLSTTRTWGEMIKISHSVFALPFAVIASFLAGRHTEGGIPTWTQLGLILVCMVSARSFAMTFNRVADAEIDARNPRSANRPIPSRKITVGQAWIFLLLSGMAFLAGCLGFWAFYENRWPAYLGIPVLLILAAYSYAKRVTSLTHFVLGAAISLSPLSAWISVHPGSLGLPVVLLTGVVLSWIAGFDIIYACQDVDVDRRDGLFSLPSRLGIGRALVISRMCHGVTIGLLCWLGISADLSWGFWAAVCLTAVLLVVEQSLVHPGDLSRVNMAFFTINGCVSLLLGIATVCDILLL